LVGRRFIFCASGFLITGILFDTRRDPEYYRKFYARRALRIFPVFYLFALVAFIVGSQWRLGHLAFLFYVGYPAAIIFPALLQIPVHIGHLWSLTAEEQFYLIWPFLMAKVRRPLLLCGIVLFLSFSLRFVFILCDVERSWVYFFLPCRMDGLAVGATIALLWRSDWKERLQSWAPLSFGVASIAFLIVCGGHFHNAFLVAVGNDVTAWTFGSLPLHLATQKCFRSRSWDVWQIQLRPLLIPHPADARV
jgi:peptidoglycan/LPS O-acetylase OafA/YrhL